MKKVEYSQIVRRKIKELKIQLAIYKLFGINSTTQDTLDYWDE